MCVIRYDVVYKVFCFGLGETALSDYVVRTVMSMDLSGFHNFPILFKQCSFFVVYFQNQHGSTTFGTIERVVSERKQNGLSPVLNGTQKAFLFGGNIFKKLFYAKWDLNVLIEKSCPKMPEIYYAVGVQFRTFLIMRLQSVTKTCQVWVGDKRNNNMIKILQSTGIEKSLCAICKHKILYYQIKNTIIYKGGLFHVSVTATNRLNVW